MESKSGDPVMSRMRRRRLARRRKSGCPRQIGGTCWSNAAQYVASYVLCLIRQKMLSDESEEEVEPCSYNIERDGIPPLIRRVYRLGTGNSMKWNFMLGKCDPDAKGGDSKTALELLLTYSTATVSRFEPSSDLSAAPALVRTAADVYLRKWQPPSSSETFTIFSVLRALTERDDLYDKHERFDGCRLTGGLIHMRTPAGEHAISFVVHGRTLHVCDSSDGGQLFWNRSTPMSEVTMNAVVTYYREARITEVTEVYTTFAGRAAPRAAQPQGVAAQGDYRMYKIIDDVHHRGALLPSPAETKTSAIQNTQAVDPSWSMTRQDYQDALNVYGKYTDPYHYLYSLDWDGRETDRDALVEYLVPMGGPQYASWLADKEKNPTKQSLMYVQIKNNLPMEVRVHAVKAINEFRETISPETFGMPPNTIQSTAILSESAFAIHVGSIHGRHYGQVINPNASVSGPYVTIDLMDFFGFEADYYCQPNSIVGTFRELQLQLERTHPFLENLDIREQDALTGGIPPEISRLTTIHLALMENENLRGPLPPEIGNLSNLETLFLKDNNFTGSIPNSISGLSALQALEIEETGLTGAIPDAIGNLRNLVQLVIMAKVSGPIPDTIGRLTALDTLHIKETNISGPIPSSIGDLVNLHELILFNNDLSGPIPDTIGRLTSLRALTLVGDDLSGPIPDMIGRLTALQALRLQGRFSGPIPPSIGNLTQAKYVVLSDNDLEGPVPQSIADMAELIHLGLHNNRLTGEIPDVLTRLSNLRKVTLHGNDIARPVPPGFGDNVIALSEEID